MKIKIFIVIIIIFLIIITSGIILYVYHNINNEMEGHLYSPVKNGSKFRYGISITGGTYLNNSSKYHNELSLCNFPNGTLNINVHGNAIYGNLKIYGASLNHTSKVRLVVNKTINFSLNSNLFKAFFPKKQLHSGSSIPFGNKTVHIASEGFDGCSISRNFMMPYSHGIYFVPFYGKLSNVHNATPEIAPNSCNVPFYAQSHGYAILEDLSFNANSSLIAALLGNIGIKNIIMRIGVDKTNVQITDINYSIYIDNYIPILLVIWIVGAAYSYTVVRSSVKRRDKNK